MNLYTVRDKVAEECASLFEAPNDDVAVRKVRMGFKGYPGSVADFTLLCIGSFDTKSGELTADHPRIIDADLSFALQAKKEV